MSAAVDGQVLLRLAREAIACALGQAPPPAVPDQEWLAEPGATFVTLTTHGELRGCIGTVDPRRSLASDVQANAVSAATRDPRFLPLEAAELADTHVEVSLLSPVERVPAATEDEALEQMRPFVEGYVLSVGHRRAVLLPQVWDRRRTPRAFLDALKAKAGVPADVWTTDPRVELSRFTLDKWKD